MQHTTIAANGASFHLVRHGSGKELLLLHGWPEFWLTWEPVMSRLAARHALIAPDLRGFGNSSKPAGPWGAEKHADDLLALLDALDVGRVGIVGHDVGGAVMQVLARRAPERIAGLFFFDFVYPGIGRRMGDPDRLNEIWYQSFHQIAWAPALIGGSRAACGTYIGHFLRHWAHRKQAFDDVLDAFIDNFLLPGNLEGGFAYYRAAHAARIVMMEGRVPSPPPIAIATAVRWAAHDVLFPPAWTDRLGETFTNLDLSILPDVGHFPHREDPDRSAAEIADFFARIGWC